MFSITNIPGLYLAKYPSATYSKAICIAILLLATSIGISNSVGIDQITEASIYLYVNQLLMVYGALAPVFVLVSSHTILSTIQTSPIYTNMAISCWWQTIRIGILIRCG